MLLTNACSQRSDRQHAKVNLKYQQFSCKRKLFILAQGFIMKRINYFLFLGFIYLLQKVFLVFIFHICILKFSPCIGGISLCYHSESFKGSEESPTLFIFKHMFGPLQAGSFPSHTIANHLFCWLLIHMHVYIELLVCLM